VRPPSPHLVLAAAALAGVAAATPQEPASTYVSAARSEDPATASPLLDVSVSGEQLEATGERSLPRALGKAAGVWIQETSLGGGAPVIGGLLGNRIVIVVDGVRLNDSTTRSGPNQYLNAIPPEAVERIDVLRGPSAVLYGSDAVGGAVLIWTRRRDPARGDEAARGLRGEAAGEYLSAAAGWRGSVGASWAGEADGLFATAGWEDWGDLRSGGGQEWPTAYDGGALFGSWTHDLGPGRGLRLTALASRQADVPRTDRLVTGFGQTQPANDVWDYALQDRRRYVGAYTDASSGGFADRFDVRLSLRSYTEERAIRKTGSDELTHERDEVVTVGVGMDWKKALGEAHLLTWGFDLDHDQVDSSASTTDLGSGTTTPGEGAFAPDARYTSGGVFVQDELLALAPLDVTAGLRWSWFDFGFDPFESSGESGRQGGSFQAVTASLAAAGDLAEGVRLTGVLAQGFRAPNLEDLANESNFFGGTELPDPDLDPERSLSAQLALDVARASWGVSLGVWHTWLQDLIGRRLVDEGDPGQTGDETYQRANAGRASLLGADLAARNRLGGLTSPWSLEGTLSWAWGQQYDSTVDPATGGRPLDDVPFRRIPPLFGRAALVWDGPRPGDSVDRVALSAHFAGPQDRLNPEDESDPRIDPEGTGGWARLDLDLEGPLDPTDSRARARWHLGVHNLLDASYRVHASGLDAPGFGVILGVRVTL
jgi:outer membrane receptor protein involved in Fe transport